MIKETDWIPSSKINLEDDSLVFALGDVHGHIDSVKEITEYVEKTYPDSFKISLGDVIDRGPDSIGSLKYVLEHYDVCLPGNHELLMLGTAFNIPYYSNVFYSNGGSWARTLMEKDEMSLLDTLKYHLGDTLYNKLIQNGLLEPTKQYNPTLHYEVGNLVFIHAGINPNRTMDYRDWIYQDVIYNLYSDSPVWIRDSFLTHKLEYATNPELNIPIVVVHGHSFEHYITHEPTAEYPNGVFPPGYTRLDGYRLGLDTGNFHTGILTGALFKNGYYKIINSIR